VQVTVNGATTDVDPTFTVGALIAARGEAPRRVAVALNGEVVPRSRWESTALTDGDSLEVLAPTAGG
jgi:sulfur carrier protein